MKRPSYRSILIADDSIRDQITGEMSSSGLKQLKARFLNSAKKIVIFVDENEVADKEERVWPRAVQNALAVNVFIFFNNVPKTARSENGKQLFNS